jgi:tRNA nucleotidyltransferase (CCA-adding enzyme)
MDSTFEEVSTTVLNRITPTQEEREKVLSIAEKLVEKVKKTAKKARVEAEVRVEGSVAKDTWLREEPDIDIFIRVPIIMSRENFRKVSLKIAKEATEGFKQVERFAEHPYLEAFVNSTRVNIVPCYGVKKGEWMSATDRTPFHTDYVKPKLNEQLRSGIRLLKQFMRGINVYGAEIKIGGFSGYLCELLVLNYGSFANVLKAAADIKSSWLIDYASYYEGREDELQKIFSQPLIVIDPVDKGRNVASALRKERLFEFVVAGREFLKKPHLKFFYPPETKALGTQQILKEIKKRKLIFIKFDCIEAVSDVLWGQLYKTKEALRRLLEGNDFHVIRDTSWSNEQDLNMLIFELQNDKLPLIKKHLGPPIRKRAECENFLQKHVNSTSTLSGPYLESERWVVEIKRKYVDAKTLFNEILKEGGRNVGVAELVSQAFKKAFDVFVNEQIMELYSSDLTFAKFFTEYLKAKPQWLDKTP